MGDQGQDERDGEEEDDDGDAGDGGEVAGGEGAATFAGVLAVGFEVEEVVDDVGGGGAEAKAEEGDQGAGEEAGGAGVGEEQGKEEEDVLGPLVEADGFEPGFEGGDGLVEGADWGDVGGAEGGAEARGGVGDHGLVAVVKKREVGDGVADVGEVVAEAGSGRRRACFCRRG